MKKLHKCSPFTLIELLVSKTWQICVSLLYYFRKSIPLFLKEIEGAGERENFFSRPLGGLRKNSPFSTLGLGHYGMISTWREWHSDFTYTPVGSQANIGVNYNNRYYIFKKIPNPSSFGLVADSWDEGRKHMHQVIRQISGSGYGVAPNTYNDGSFALAHNGNGNMLMVDGHVESWSEGQVNSAGGKSVAEKKTTNISYTKTF